ncbi:MAG TPA: thrombospondin type 3 repeat-containing protein [Polyangia bacterium]|nr:thrombospondin type 3 repeat-containing protein [Polyangia bacterium]
MSRHLSRGLVVGAATVAAVISVAGSVRAQVTPGPRRPPPADPSHTADTWDKHTSIGLELGPGGVITSYDVNDSPSALLFYGSVRGSYDLSQDWSGGLTLRQWWLPSSNHATMLGLTARFEPKVYDWGRTFIDAAIGVTSTSFAWALGFDVGGGIEWNIPDAPGLSIGPYVRYNQVLNPDNRTSDDGRAWSVGGSFTYHFGRAAAAEKAEGPVRRGGAYRISVPDADKDGIGDDEDVCKNVPQGKHPDPFKPGCPENDEDGDDVPDVDDACPVTPPGPNPDPKRPGCPLVDTDKDGIPDPDDACPLKPGPATADPTHSGCPVDKRRGGAPEEGAAPPADNNQQIEPTPIKKRKMK